MWAKWFDAEESLSWYLLAVYECMNFLFLTIINQIWHITPINDNINLIPLLIFILFEHIIHIGFHILVVTKSKEEHIIMVNDMNSILWIRIRLVLGNWLFLILDGGKSDVTAFLLYVAVLIWFRTWTLCKRSAYIKPHMLWRLKWFINFFNFVFVIQILLWFENLI